MSDDPGTMDASVPRGPHSRRRPIAAALLMLTITAGLLVHSLAPDVPASDIAGDALYAIAAYLAVVIVAPHLRTPFVALVAASWCTFVELFQLTGVPLRLGADFSPIMLVLGTVFDPRDLAVYLVTIAVVLVADLALEGPRTSAG
ncbi:MAG: DUF2809 domain-containing protein [Microbacterium sp.]|uniref:DUF2809 domain-containing protein n=1 Tax=Microbacterium sp. TaxID=51671 RepID=UPI002725A9C2|nr:DUF2809 domain-containing protein [Microbacterium sp.]MDO8384307.1 DUF2809 domain-containing protein [Microbacterium sp.]